ncbi:MAG: ATP-binding protein [Burkholderiaceae bacterium]
MPHRWPNRSPCRWRSGPRRRRPQARNPDQSVPAGLRQRAGVPEQERERIFEPFYRRRGASEQAGGVGLGLSLVRQIARAHQGSVTCQAREGGGSCFELLLPLPARSQAAQRA